MHINPDSGSFSGDNDAYGSEFLLESIPIEAKTTQRRILPFYGHFISTSRKAPRTANAKATSERSFALPKPQATFFLNMEFNLLQRRLLQMKNPNDTTSSSAPSYTFNSAHPSRMPILQN
jgi:hypothetical protein